MTYVDRLKAHIDFPSAKTFQITTPYRQKTFGVSSLKYIDLEKLVEIKPKNNKLTLPDFWIEVREDGEGGYYYEVLAVIGQGRRDVISSFQHNQATTAEVKIYRYKK